MELIKKIIARIKGVKVFSSIFAKLLAVFLGVTVLLILALGISSYTFSSDFILDLSETQLAIVPRQIAVRTFDIVEDNLGGNLAQADQSQMLMWSMTDLEQQLESTRQQVIMPLGFESRVYLVDDEDRIAIVTADGETELDEDDNLADKEYYQEIQAIEEDQFRSDVEEDLEDEDEEIIDDEFARRISASGQVNFERDGQKRVAFFSRVHPMGWNIIVEVPEDQIRMPMNVLRTMITIAIVIAILIVTIVAILFAKGISKPIGAITSGMERLAGGDFKATIDINRNDELGVLATSYNKLVKSQRGLINQIKTVIESLNNSSSELTNISDSFISDVDTTLDEVNRISASTEEVSASSEQVATMADETTNIVKDGNQSIELVIKQMDKIKKTVNQSVEVIDQLDDKSVQIGEIVDLITNISEQTNLLALNAAIEAARAGEAGKGFAVVADEIRDLARQSAEAAEKISGLVEETQTESDKAVDAIKSGTQEVEQGEEVINEAGKAFVGIQEATNETALQMEDTSAATEELAESASEVVNVVSELERRSGNVKDTAKELEEKAKRLEDLIEEFKV